MPDISMCKNQTCELRSKCYRYRAIPGEWQSYMLGLNPENGICTHFWDAEGYRVRPTEEVDSEPNPFKDM